MLKTWYTVNEYLTTFEFIMGQASGGMSDNSDRFCLCMMDNNNQDLENCKWIFCKGCKKWFHQLCCLVSDEEYDRATDGGEDWFCFDFECQELSLLGTTKPGDGKQVRKRLNRKCKERIDNDVSPGIMIEDLPHGRVSCEVCGFLAKNRHGLNIHMRVHKRVSENDELVEDEDGRISEFSAGRDVSDILDEFGLLLNCCRLSVPLTRIIQKSVRIVVCQELTKVINDLLKDNSVDSWMRLIAFPYIVLSNKTKGNGGVNVIRSNLVLFRNCTDINKALSEV